MPTTNSPYCPVPAYVSVIHATEQVRQERYRGCVSRQALRAQLRKEKQQEASRENPKLPRAAIRRLAMFNAQYAYQKLLGVAVGN